MLKRSKDGHLVVTRKQLWARLLFGVLITALPLTAQAQGSNKRFSGVWETVAGSATRYTVRLTQVGNKVTGTYSPYHGKIFGGTVVGNKVTFKWSQDGGWEGTGEFTLNDDGKGFSGSSTATKPEVVTHTWSTYTPAPPSSFAGAWNTTLGYRKIALTIAQTGNKVTGTYSGDNGTITGTILEKTLRFTWKSDKGSGSGKLMISTSGMTFTGWTNTGTDPDVEGTRWEGIRPPEG